MSFKFGKLASYDNIVFKYDILGNRRCKGTSKDNATKYIYEDGKLIIQRNPDGTELEFIYGDSSIIGFKYKTSNETKLYYFRKNILGDVIELYYNGNVEASYAYDAWGNHVVYGANGDPNTSTTFIGNINPIRYRGYYYDVETQLFYCNSRYYSPELCRWISPDSIEYLDPESINGLNLYCYCGNNPIMYSDPSGHIALSTLLISMAIGAVIGFATSYVPDVVKNFGDGFEWSDFNTFEDNWLKYVGATLGGAISGMGVGLGTTILASGIGNVVEAAFAGNIDTFGDFLLQFTIGGVLGGVGFRISNGIASSLADKKILGILGSLNNNTKVNKRLAKAGFDYLKIARDGFSKVYNTMYEKLGYKSLEKGISIGYDVLTGFIF